jgi:integrating conjugative element membrane protein (TIGR03747 family)
MAGSDSAVLNPENVSSASRGGPIGLLFVTVFGIISSTLFAWAIAIIIALVGGQFFWQKLGAIGHAQSLIEEDLGYIADAPQSLFVDDTVAFSKDLMRYVSIPFLMLGVPPSKPLLDQAASTTFNDPAQKQSTGIAIKKVMLSSRQELRELGYLAMLCAQETVLRLAVAFFAIPAFILAVLVGAVDGLVRRDLRKWQGGRESSFVYHHAKAMTWLMLGGGFSLYLAWPTGGFNPGYMVLVFTVLTAYFLSLTIFSFKKYI